jgi:hypothetical protein
MARGTVFICDRCGGSIHDMAVPVIVCVNVGHVNGGGEIVMDEEDGVDDYTAELLGSGDMRREYCAKCWKAFFTVCPTEVAACTDKRVRHEVLHGLRPAPAEVRIPMPPEQPGVTP